MPRKPPEVVKLPPAGAQYEEQTYRIAPVEELHEHPENPRQGDVGAIVTSIDANGFYGALVVQKSTRFVLAGNHRLKALRARGVTHVPIIERDVDDQTALKILLVDNRSGDLASYDEVKLLELLTLAAESGYLEGTGYDGDDLDDMRMQWESDLRGVVDRPGANSTAGSFTVRFDESDRDAVRGALERAFAELGIETVSFS